MESIYIAIVLFPLVAAVIAGLFGRVIGRSGTHWITITAVAISFVLSVVVFQDQLSNPDAVFNGSVYTWMLVDGIRMEEGFLIDRLYALMMVVVTIVSFMVNI